MAPKKRSKNSLKIAIENYFNRLVCHQYELNSYLKAIL